MCHGGGQNLLKTHLCILYAIEQKDKKTLF